MTKQTYSTIHTLEPKGTSRSTGRPLIRRSELVEDVATELVAIPPTIHLVLGPFNDGRGKVSVEDSIARESLAEPRQFPNELVVSAVFDAVGVHLSKRGGRVGKGLRHRR